MINKGFWTKVAEKWRMDNDGINIPKVEADVSLITDEDLIPFDSITDACNFSGAKAGNITKCIKGIRNTCAGYVWKLHCEDVVLC